MIARPVRDLAPIAERLRPVEALRRALWTCERCGGVYARTAPLYVRAADRVQAGVLLRACGVARAPGAPPEVWCAGCVGVLACRVGVMLPREAGRLALAALWDRAVARSLALEELGALAAVRSWSVQRREMRAELRAHRWSVALRARWGAAVTRATAERGEVREALAAIRADMVDDVDGAP